MANAALWIAELQANQDSERVIHRVIDDLPLKDSGNIVLGNALKINWSDVLPNSECDYVLGNPPFVGGMMMSSEQTAEVKAAFNGLQGVGELDYVTAWYAKAAEYIRYTPIKCAFVSTNSICQGLPVGIFWKYLKVGCNIDILFAYRTFVWNSEAKSNAHVHCVIVGFCDKKFVKSREIFAVSPDAMNTGTVAGNINGYLLDAQEIYIQERSKPISEVPPMRFGSMPRGKGFTITAKQKEEFLRLEPQSSKWIRPYWGAEEFLKRKERYCLWLVDASPAEIAKSPMVLERIEQIRSARAASNASDTRKLAETPTLFAQIAQPESDYLIVPRVSSERRDYVPIGKVSKEVIASDATFLVPSATLYHFGVMSSRCHNAWMRLVAGRLKSDYRYAKDLVYNTFVWPESSTSQREAIEDMAQAVLGAREQYIDEPIGTLYRRDLMPPALLKAHHKLDRAVEVAFGMKPNISDSEIVSLLFDLYENAIDEEGCRR